jgi:hypothetical protein
MSKLQDSIQLLVQLDQALETTEEALRPSSALDMSATKASVTYSAVHAAFVARTGITKANWASFVGVTKMLRKLWSDAHSLDTSIMHRTLMMLDIHGTLTVYVEAGSRSERNLKCGDSYQIQRSDLIARALDRGAMMSHTDEILEALIVHGHLSRPASQPELDVTPLFPGIYLEGDLCRLLAF